jgi:hypothetical protein
MLEDFIEQIKLADVTSLDHFLEDLRAWYDLTEGWRNGEGDPLQDENVADQCDSLLNALEKDVRAVIEQRQANGEVIRPLLDDEEEDYPDEEEDYPEQ